MRIAVVSGIAKRTLPTSKGGLETWTGQFVEELSRRGHAVDLFAIGGSIENKNIKLHSLLEKPLPTYLEEPFFNKDGVVLTRNKDQFISTIFGKALAHIQKHESEYDLIVDSCSFPTFTYNLNLINKPVFIIGHFPVDFTFEFYSQHFPTSVNTHFIFPSKFQHDQATFIPKSKRHVIPHGIDLKPYTFHPKSKDHLLWLGRYHTVTNKGLREAILIAEATHRKLKVRAFIEQSSRSDFDNLILPLIKNSKCVDFKEEKEVSTFDKDDFFGNGKALLYPIQWDEPFGLVFLEAMATGTPIIAFNRGAVGEIITDKKNGYLVEQNDNNASSLLQMQKVVNDLFALDEVDYQVMRQQCREKVTTSYSVEKMVNTYLEHYSKIKS